MNFAWNYLLDRNQMITFFLDFSSCKFNDFRGIKVLYCIVMLKKSNAWSIHWIRYLYTFNMSKFKSVKNVVFFWTRAKTFPLSTSSLTMLFELPRLVKGCTCGGFNWNSRFTSVREEKWRGETWSVRILSKYD